jgi:membrane protein YdbS with pleckstrin-like domain
MAWSSTEDVVMFKSGWLNRHWTIARVNKVQSVSTHESPLDRRAAMARLRVDTAGAGEFAHRVDIPFLGRDVAEGLRRRLAAQAAETDFRW